jgi:phosphoenolpyruvate carboxykinase (ATP)
MKLEFTRAIVTAALSGQLDHVHYVTDPVFGLEVPSKVPGVPSDLLAPRTTWADPVAYDAQAAKLAEMFRKNFAAFAAEVPPEVIAAGPR